MVVERLGCTFTMKYKVGDKVWLMGIHQPIKSHIFTIIALSKENKYVVQVKEEGYASSWIDISLICPVN